MWRRETVEVWRIWAAMCYSPVILRITWNLSTSIPPATSFISWLHCIFSQILAHPHSGKEDGSPRTWRTCACGVSRRDNLTMRVGSQGPPAPWQRQRHHGEARSTLCHSPWASVSWWLGGKGEGNRRFSDGKDSGCPQLFKYLSLKLSMNLSFLIFLLLYFLFFPSFLPSLFFSSFLLSFLSPSLPSFLQQLVISILRSSIASWAMPRVFLWEKSQHSSNSCASFPVGLSFHFSIHLSIHPLSYSNGMCCSDTAAHQALC